MLQDDIFRQTEGDSWFARNRAALGAFDASADLPLRLLELYNLRPQSVIEIGAANGVRLAAIERWSGARCVALEPSADAICDGKASFPALTFIRGSAGAVPVKESFDLVIVNFVLHWIDRVSLLRSVGEIDRLVKDGGFLIIGDFQPANFIRARYHHLTDSEVYTYKQDYPALFRSAGLYHPVAMLSADHSTKALDPRAVEHDRIGATLLRKELLNHYMHTGENGLHG